MHLDDWLMICTSHYLNSMLQELHSKTLKQIMIRFQRLIMIFWGLIDWWLIAVVLNQLYWLRHNIKWKQEVIKNENPEKLIFLEMNWLWYGQNSRRDKVVKYKIDVMN